MKDENESVKIETVEESYKITDEICYTKHQYDFGEYGEGMVEKIKGQIEFQLKDTISGLRQHYDSDIPCEIKWWEDEETDHQVVKVTLEAEKDISLDFIGSTVVSTFIHENPRNAYQMVLANKKWLEKHQRKEISDLMDQ